MNCQVLLSTYNGQSFIREQLQSILNQKNVEANILVRDDGSIDNTISILKEFPNISLILGKNLGIKKCFFELIRLSSENYNFYAFSDQDDYWLEDKLYSAISKFLKEDNTVPLLYCSNLTVVNESLNGHKYFYSKDIIPNIDNLLVENFATGCTIVFNKKLRDFFLNQSINENNIIIHDWWLALIAKTIGKIIYDKNSYILYRQHSKNQIGAYYNRIMFRKLLKIFNKNTMFLHQIYEYILLYNRLYGRNISEYKIITNCSSFLSRIIYLFNCRLRYRNIFHTIQFYLLYSVGYYKY